MQSQTAPPEEAELQDQTVGPANQLIAAREPHLSLVDPANRGHVSRPQPGKARSYSLVGSRRPEPKSAGSIGYCAWRSESSKANDR